jgi:predicted phage tail protein
MARHPRVWLVLFLLGLVSACAFAASASAYTYVVRPNTTTITGSWTIVPSGSIDSVLDDNVLSPTAPSTASDYVNANGNGPMTFEVGLSDVTLRGGENVTSVRSWGYAATGDARTLDTELRHGTTVLASGTWPSSVPAQWQSLLYTGSLTQAELNDLRQRRTLQGTGASTHTFVYAAYAEVATDMSAAPAITPPTTPSQVTNPTWAFSATAAASYQCKLEKGVTLVSDWAACTSGHGYNLVPTGDGTYTFSVRALDDVGTPQATATHTYDLDRSAPVAPTIDTAPTDPTNNPLAAWTFTGEGGSTVESCRLERGATVVVDWTLCSSPFSHNLGAEADGTYTFRVRSTDMAGNQGLESTDTFVLDRSGPAAPTLTAEPPATHDNPSPSWSFTHEAGATATCRLERGATVVSDWGPCTSPASFDLGGEVDGTYTFRVRATDAATNPGAITSDTYVLDRVDPAAPSITGGPAGDSQNAAPAYTFTTDAGTTTECRLQRGATVVEDWTACVSGKAYDLSLQADGAYTFRVRATDAATNTGPEATRSYTLDRLAPAAPVITSGPAAESSDDTPTYDFTSEPGATTECRVERGATVVSDWAPCTTAHTADLTAEPDGVYTFRVRAIDAALNTGPDDQHTYTLDTSAPAPPTITGGPTGDSQNASPAYTFTAGAGETTQCRMERGATVIEDWTLCISGKSYNLGAEVDGTYTFRVRALDGATNVGGDSSRSYALDRTAPAAPTITSAPPATGNDPSPSWSFTGDAGTSAECRIQRGAAVVSDWAPCASPRSYALGGEVDGTYTFRVRSVDAASNTGPEATGTYVLDRNAPVAPTITGGPTGDSQNATPAYTFTGEAGATFECRMQRGVTIIENWTACASGKSYNLGAQVDGTYTFRVRAIDTATNTGPDATRSYTLDRSAPAAPVITGGPPANSADPAPSLTFTYEGGANATCRLTRGATVVVDWEACSSPKGYDLSAQPDGAYTFRVRATDAAGNTGTEATRNWNLDRVAPDAPTITGRPASITNDDTPTWSFTASFDVVKYRCRIERGATVVSDYAVCTSPHTYDLTGQPDGTYTFKVRGSDDSANESTETNDTFTLDRSAPPAPTITGGPTGFSQNATPSYTFTAEAGSSTACRVERGATVVSDWAACVSPRSYDFSLQPDGVYTFRVRATDQAGNTGLEGTRSYTLDRTAPAAPTITSGPAADSNDDTPVYGFTGEPSATFACRLERGATVVSDWAACSTPQGYNLGSEVDGSYTFRVRQTDQAGNEGPEATRVYALDRTPPAAPAITGDPGADTNDDTPTWTFTSAAGTTTACRIERGATVVSDWAACASPRTYDLSAQPQGTYTFRVRATDAAGNTGADAAHTTTLDRTAPPAPTITGGPVSDTADPTPAFTFTAESGATTACRIERGATVVSDWAACSSPRSYDLSAQVDGTYTFRVRATDAAGNTGAEATRSFTLDRLAPNQPTITGRPNASTNDDTPTWTWTGDSGSAYNCRVTRGATVVVDWASCTSPRTIDLSSEPDATYTFRVRASDPAGNVSTEANDTFALDRVAPPAPGITGGPTGESNNQLPSYTFTAEAGASTACRIERGATVVEDWTACTSGKAYDLSLQADGAYTFRVRATDAAGNTGAESTRSYTLDRVAPAAPTITSAPSGQQQDDTPTYAWTGEIGAAASCRVERGATVVSDWAACSTPHTHGLASEVDGAYTFRVRLTDPAGNTGADSATTYTLDRTAPAAPTITSGPAADSTDDSPSYAFTGEAGATLACRLQRGATVISDWAACTSPEVYDLSAEPDGAYTFRVRATDAAGNTGADGTRVYTLDRTVPISPVLDARPGDDGNDQTPEWAFSTTESPRTFECRLARGATVLFDWGPCVSPRQFDLALEPDGAYSFGVRAVNLAGTRSAPTTDVYNLDTAAPAAPVVSGGPAPDSTDETPTWTITPEPGATLECRLERGATVIADWTACSSPQGYDLAAEPDGTYTFLTRATDPAGNTGADGSASYNLDRTVPLEPVLGPNPPAAGNDATPTWEFTGEPGKTFECKLSRGATVVSDWAVCTSPHTPDLSTEPDGDYTLEIVAINPAGTRSPVTSDDYELDRGVPAAPTITGGPAADSSDDTPTWNWTGEAAATFECRLERGAAVVEDWTSCTDPRTNDLNAEPDGTYTFRVRQTDPAGNVSPDASRSYNLDRTVPASPSIDARPVSPGPDQTPEWTVSGLAGLTIECRLTRGATVVADWADCSGLVAYDLTTEPDGTYRLHARQYNAAGTRGPEVTDDYVLDATVPAAPTITGRPGDVANGSVPQWSFSAETGSSVECRLERGLVEVRPWAACTSPRSYNLGGEPDGDYTFYVRATDGAGNVSPPATDEHRVDRVPPAPPGITENPGPLGRTRTPAWGFTAEPGAVFECTLAGVGGAVDEWAFCASPRGYDLGGRGDGSYAFGVRARDAAGNTSPATSSQYTLDTTPGGVVIEGGPPALGSDRAPAWRFSGEEGASFECRLALRNVPVADWSPCTSPKGWDLTGRPDGVFGFSLRAVDPAGNIGPEGTAAYELDTTPPDAPDIMRRPESPGDDRTPTWRFAGEANATFTCRVERQPAGIVLDWSLCASPFTADLAREQDGDYRFSVRATDLAGNTGEDTTSSYQLARTGQGDEGDKGGEEGETGDVPEEDEDEAAPLTRKPRRSKPAGDAEPAAKPRRRRDRPDPAAAARRPGRLAPDKSTAPAPEPKPEERGGNFATRAIGDAVKAIAKNPDKSVFPLSLLLLVLAFLAIQNRIDRSDPKLALAPTFADPDLEFRPPPGDIDE